MGFITEEQKGVTVIKIADKRLDSMIAPQLKSEILFLSNEGVDKILLDLSDVNYADSSGLGSFLFGVRQMRRNNGQFKHYSANERIMSLVRIARLDKILDSKEVKALIIALGSAIAREFDIEKHWRDQKVIGLWMGGKGLKTLENARYWYDLETL